jgi:membrane protein implicated in regulation of membrane protease activity
MNSSVLLWFGVALFFLLFELGSPGLFYFLSFFYGALISALLALLGLSLFDQMIMFLLFSIASFFALKAWVKRSDKNHYRSNMYALQGQHGVVVTPPTEYQFGYVHIAGELWACKNLGNQEMTAGATVQVVDIKGAHLIVKMIKVTENK